KLLHITGIAEIGPPESTLVTGSLRCAEMHALRHEVLPAPELMRRFPAFRVPCDFVGVVQPDGGILKAEASVLAQLALAAAAGAAGPAIHGGESGHGGEPCAGCGRIVADRGSIEAGAAIIAAGAWVKSLLPALAAPLRITREVMAWFEPIDAQLSRPGRLPVFMIESRHGLHYGIPGDGSVQRGIKVAKHHHRDETVDPAAYDQTLRTHH